MTLNHPIRHGLIQMTISPNRPIQNMLIDWNMIYILCVVLDVVAVVVEVTCESSTLPAANTKLT